MTFFDIYLLLKKHNFNIEKAYKSIECVGTSKEELFIFHTFLCLCGHLNNISEDNYEGNLDLLLNQYAEFPIIKDQYLPTLLKILEQKNIYIETNRFIELNKSIFNNPEHHYFLKNFILVFGRFFGEGPIYAVSHFQSDPFSIEIFMILFKINGSFRKMVSNVDIGSKEFRDAPINFFDTIQIDSALIFELLINDNLFIDKSKLKIYNSDNNNNSNSLNNYSDNSNNQTLNNNNQKSNFLSDIFWFFICYYDSDNITRYLLTKYKNEKIKKNEINLFEIDLVYLLELCSTFASCRVIKSIFEIHPAETIIPERDHLDGIILRSDSDGQVKKVRVLDCNFIFQKHNTPVFNFINDFIDILTENNIIINLKFFSKYSSYPNYSVYKSLFYSKPVEGIKEEIAPKYNNPVVYNAFKKGLEKYKKEIDPDLKQLNDIHVYYNLSNGDRTIEFELNYLHIKPRVINISENELFGIKCEDPACSYLYQNKQLCRHFFQILKFFNIPFDTPMFFSNERTPLELYLLLLYCRDKNNIPNKYFRKRINGSPWFSSFYIEDYNNNNNNSIVNNNSDSQDNSELILNLNRLSHYLFKFRNNSPIFHYYKDVQDLFVRFDFSKDQIPLSIISNLKVAGTLSPEFFSRDKLIRLFINDRKIQIKILIQFWNERPRYYFKNIPYIFFSQHRVLEFLLLLYPDLDLLKELIEFENFEEFVLNDPIVDFFLEKNFVDPSKQAIISQVKKQLQISPLKKVNIVMFIAAFENPKESRQLEIIRDNLIIPNFGNRNYDDINELIKYMDYYIRPDLHKSLSNQFLQDLLLDEELEKKLKNKKKQQQKQQQQQKQEKEKLEKEKLEKEKQEKEKQEKEKKEKLKLEREEKDRLKKIEIQSNNNSSTVQVKVETQVLDNLKLNSNNKNNNSSSNNNKSKNKKNKKPKDTINNNNIQKLKVNNKPKNDSDKNNNNVNNNINSNSISNSYYKINREEETLIEDINLIYDIQVGKFKFNRNENNILGMGSNGTLVFKGIWNNRIPVAIKQMHKIFNPNIKKEIEALIKLTDKNCNNVIRYIDQEEDENFVFLGLTLCGKSLQDLIASNELDQFKNNDVNNNRIKELILDIVYGVQFLHSNDIVHNDLNPRNILTKDGRFIISDLGLSKLEVASSFSFSSNVPTGQEGFHPSEVLLEKRKTKAVDIFSLGCILYYFMTNGQHPFGERFFRLGNILVNKFNLDSIKVDYPILCDLIQKMISKDEVSRPTIDQVLQHPYFWDSVKKIQFIDKLNNLFKDNTLFNSNLNKLLNLVDIEDSNGGNSISSVGSITYLSKPWNQIIDIVLLEHLSNKSQNFNSNKKIFTYNYDSIKDLVRCIRNTIQHHKDIQKSIQSFNSSAHKEIILSLSTHESVLQYFESKFPDLIFFLYYKFKNNNNFKKLDLLN